MKILIVEDDYASRTVTHRLLLPFGETQVAVNGNEAVTLFASAMESGQPFDLVCLDIMLPGMDGQSVLREIRALEASRSPEARKPARVIMTTALNDRTNVVEAIKACDAYLVKPIDRKKLLASLKGFGFEPAGAPASQ
jgi:two-component system, chemotaxis family, chemotaxis protein CheY